MIYDQDRSPVAAANVYKSKGALDIDVLGSVSPGAGTEVIKAAVKYSDELGLGGALQLTPLGSSVSFYGKRGFDVHPTQSGRFYLSEKAAIEMGYLK